MTRGRVNVGASMLVSREECLRCAKPLRLCVCALVPRIENRTRIVVVQHPRERAHAIGTARFVELGLAASEVHVAHGLEASHVIDRLPRGRTALLYPSHTSVLLDTLDESSRPDVLVVLDGTWPQARTLYRANPWLAKLPHVRLAPSQPSRYRIRKEPSASCVSTVEATLLALESLEPEIAGTDALIAAFDAMIDAQIAEQKGATGRRRRTRGRRTFVGVPRALGEDVERLVLVYADMSLRGASGARCMLRFNAVRFVDGALFDAFVTPREPFDASRIPADAPELARSMVSGEAMDDAAERFRAFAGDDAIVGAWNGEFANRLSRLVPASEAFDLGAAYRAIRGAGIGVLDRVILHEGIASTPLALDGRAGPRLANALALARHLRAVAQDRFRQRDPFSMPEAPSE